jgi:hypothetical protein
MFNMQFNSGVQEGKRRKSLKLYCIWNSIKTVWLDCMCLKYNVQNGDGSLFIGILVQLYNVQCTIFCTSPDPDHFALVELVQSFRIWFRIWILGQTRTRNNLYSLCISNKIRDWKYTYFLRNALKRYKGHFPWVTFTVRSGSGNDLKGRIWSGRQFP